MDSPRSPSWSSTSSRPSRRRQNTNKFMLSHCCCCPKYFLSYNLVTTYYRIYFLTICHQLQLSFGTRASFWFNNIIQLIDLKAFLTTISTRSKVLRILFLVNGSTNLMSYCNFRCNLCLTILS